MLILGWSSVRTLLNVDIELLRVLGVSGCRMTYQLILCDVLSVNRLKEAGVAKIYAICTHGILSGPAINNINASNFECVVVTNTVPQDVNMSLSSKLQVCISIV